MNVIGLHAQKSVTVNGFIEDAYTGERLIGATIWLENESIGSITNKYGYFSIKTKEGFSSFIVQYVGYSKSIVGMDIQSDTLVTFSLESSNVLPEVNVIQSNDTAFLLSPAMSTYNLLPSLVKTVPSILGEADIMKVAQMLPGVSMTNEGQAGLSVRGGSPDQTLILLDGVPVYNVNHLFGYLSTFNSEILSGSTLYKGGLPSAYGGRLTSVFDISTKDGNMNKKAGSYSIGTLAGSLSFEGPLIKEKVSYFLSARRTWLDLLLHLSQLMNYEDELTYGFWDINAKLNWKIDKSDRLFLSFYTGRDAFQQNENNSFSGSNINYKIQWGNLTSVLRWNHIFSNALFVNTSLSYSLYQQEYKNFIDQADNSYFRGYNYLNDLTLKSDFSYNISNNHRFLFGYEASKQLLSPEVVELKDVDTLQALNSDTYIKSLIPSLYFEDQIILNNKTKMNIGLRASMYHVEKKNYWRVEPRLSLSYHLLQPFTIKASYSRMNQYLHMLSNTSIGVPVDMWVSSTSKIGPSFSNLYSVGFYFNKEKGMNFSGEFYYSDLHEIISYIEGAKYLQLSGCSWEDYVTMGNGEMYGAEFFAEKTTGRLNFWISYTLSWSNRKFTELNKGNSFPYKYDRRHQLKIYANYPLFELFKNGKHVSHSLSSSFVFLTGSFMTFATQEYSGIDLPYNNSNYYWFESRKYINEINNLQLPNFHHLDLSYNIKIQKGEKWNNWNFSIYNVYNHLNVYYYYKKDGEIKQVSYFPFMPSVTFTRRF